MECSHAKSCELFAQFALNPALKVWQIHFCDGDQHARCARYQLSLQGQPVPLNLLPNGKMVEAPRDNNAYGATALFNAILKDRASMVQSMLKNGIDINVRTPDGTTPLMAAVTRGGLEIMQLLVSKGADVNAQNNAGETAYRIAVRSGFMPGVELLKAFGASPSAGVVVAEGVDVQTDDAQAAAANPGARVLPLPAEKKPVAEPAGNNIYAYYLRIPAKFDRTVSVKVVAALRDLGIGTEAIMQKKPPEGESMAPILVLTHPVTEQGVFRAIAKIEALGSGIGAVTCMRLEDIPRSDKTRRAS